jgi:hypothetical protein
MKLTKNRLKQIIKEEFSAAMGENRDPEEGPEAADVQIHPTVKLVEKLDELVEKIKDSLQEYLPDEAIDKSSRRDFTTAANRAVKAFDPDTGEQVFETTS